MQLTQLQHRVMTFMVTHEPITDRATRVGKLVPAGPDIAALNNLMELHDAQMDVITVQDLQRAIAYATDQIARGKATRLPATGEQI
jgi:hypothetical protein